MPALFLKKTSLHGRLQAECKIFIERPDTKFEIFDKDAKYTWLMIYDNT